MNDLEKLKKLFHEFGIPYKEETEENGSIIVTIETGMNEKVIGYRYFCTDYTFDSEGNFLQLGIWEN